MHPIRLTIRQHWPLLGLVLSRDTLMLLETLIPTMLAGLTSWQIALPPRLKKPISLTRAGWKPDARESGSR